MWSPKIKANGGRNKFYDYMTEVEMDIKISQIDSYVKISFKSMTNN